MDQTATPDAQSAAPSAAPSDILGSLSKADRDTWRLTGAIPGYSFDDPAPDADPPPAEPVKQVASTDASAQPASEPGTPSSLEPKEKTEARFKELLADRAAHRERADRLEQELATLRKPAPTSVPPADSRPATAPAIDDPEPDPTDATTFPEGQYDLGYMKSQARWEARQEFREQQAKTNAARERETAAQSATQRQTVFATRIKDAIAADPTFADVLSTSDAEVPSDPGNPMTQVLMTSPVMVPLLKYLAAHPDESRRLAGMASRDPQTGRWSGNPTALYGEMKKLEGRLEALEGEKPPTPAPKTVSSAPPPPPTLGTKTVAAVDESDAAIARGDFRAFNQAEIKKDLARAAGR